jgi:hypothetical protein
MVLRSVGLLVVRRFSRAAALCSVVRMATNCSRDPERAPEPHSAGELSRRSGKACGQRSVALREKQIDIRAGLIWPIGSAREIVCRVLPKIEKIYRSTDAAHDAPERARFT